MSDPIKRLRELLAACTQGEWNPPHYSSGAKKKGACRCKHVLAESIMGGVCEIAVEEHARMSEGWGDNPEEAQAVANGFLIAESHNLLPLLLEVAEAARRFRDGGVGHAALNGERLEAALNALRATPSPEGQGK